MLPDLMSLQGVESASDVDLAGPKDAALRRDVAALAARAGYLPRFGIYIRHQHVSMTVEEVLLSEGGTSCSRTTRPVSKATAQASGAVANHFAFNWLNGELTLVAEEATLDSGTLPLTEAEARFLRNDALPVLRAHGMESRIGFFLMPEAPDPDHIWFEEVDQPSREMRLSWRPRSEFPELDRYATHFHLLDLTDALDALDAHATMACKPMCDRDAVALRQSAPRACKPMCDR